MKNAHEPVGQAPAELGTSAGGRHRRALLIVGAGGMLGTALIRVAPSRGYTPHAYTEAQLDITDRDATRRAAADFAAEAAKTGACCAVVNAAAYTDVEKAEDDAERAFLINESAAGRLAETACENGLAFVHVSTDFVFDGAKGAPYVETDEPNPLSVYGASKLAGERAVLSAHPGALVIRTAWTYGPGGSNFPLKILQRARALVADTSSERPVLRVVADEIGSPTYAVDLADGILALLSAGATGLYHLAGAGSCSRYELALETLRFAGFTVPGDLAVEPVPSASFPTKAPRPHEAVLDCGKAAGLGVQLPAWQDGLARFVAEL
jgi:dTDP-4-dehydrorhamnose reductase